MTAPLLELVAVFARRKNAQLWPDWAANAPQDLLLDDALAIDRLAAALGWKATRLKRRPRAQHFPLLALHPVHGWCLAEQWVTDQTIRAVTSGGPVEVPWSDDLPLHDLAIPAHVRQKSSGAFGVFRDAIARRKSMIVDATVATVVINLIALVTSIYSMQVYDRVIPRAGFSTLLVLTGGMIFALLLDMLIRNTRAVMVDREAGHIDSEVSEFFYARMQSVRLDARPKSIGTMAAQLRGIEQIRSMMSSASLFVLADLPFALLFIVVMAGLGGVVAIVPLIAFPLSLLLAFMMTRFIHATTAAAQVSGNRKNGLLVEALDGAETIKANLGGWHMLARWNRLVDEVHLHELSVKRWSTLSGSGFALLQQLSYVGVICMGAYEVSAGRMTMGAVVACSILSGRVNGPLVAALPNLIIQWGYSRSSLAALDGILDMPSDQPVDRQMIRHAKAQGMLKLDGVKFVHGGSRSGIEIGRLEIRPGERVGIIGPVGSGKSTLLRLVAGLYAPQAGHVLLDGIDVRQMAEEDLRRHIAYLPQDYRLINGSLRDNLTLGLDFPGDEALMAAAAQTGLVDLIRNHPMGLDLPIAEGGLGLSGGQRTLVGLTRLLLARPRILLLDEPTASLDQDTEKRVLQAIIRMMGNDMSLVFITHKVQLLSLVQRLVVVTAGRILADGPTKAVIEQLRTRPENAPPPPLEPGPPPEPVPAPSSSIETGAA